MPTTIINASAGSGKTYRLAVAYLQALLQPLPDGTLAPPQTILATTFTRAAASEILERVLRRLALAVISEEESQRLLSELGRPDLNRADLTRLLESVCKVMSQLQVGTIDGVFARIVRAMGLELAFPPAWTMADESMGKELALEAAERVLSGDDVQGALGEWLRYAQFKPGIRRRAALVDLLEETRFLLIDADIGQDNPELPEPAIFPADQATTLIAALGGFDIPMTKGKPPKPNSHWTKAIDTIKNMVQGEPVLISLLDGHGLMRLVLTDGTSFARVPIPQSLREILGPVVTQSCQDLKRLHEGRLPALAALGRRYHQIRRILAHAHAAYRFPEIEAAARLLPPHLSADDLYFRLDGKIQHLLLDEFQDTSLGQFRFLWPIILEVRSTGSVFFAVGDTKQSIYGWRGADRQLLERLPNWLDPEGVDHDLKREHLADNRRSSPAVLKAIELIFSNLAQAACLNPANYAEDKQLKAAAHQNAATSFIGGYRTPSAVGDNQYLAGRVRLLIYAQQDMEAEDDEAEQPGVIETILNAAEEHHRQDPNREVAILCRRHKLIPSILAGLKVRGIPASGEGGNPVTDSAAVEVVLSMITWLEHPGHTLAREHVKRSGAKASFGFGEETSDHALLRDTRRAILRRGLASVVADWIGHEQFRTCRTLHDHLRCEQLLELARRWDSGGGGRLSGFVTTVRSQRVDNPSSSRVRVMTIHAAKGLEFEAVILADIEAAGFGGDKPQFVLTLESPEQKPTVTLLPKADHAQWLGLETEYQKFQQESFEEDLSVLYVALTRAKCFLDVVLPADGKVRASLSSLVRERWGQQDPGAHLIQENAALTRPVSQAPRPVVEDDPGIANPDELQEVSGFVSVPRRLEAITPSGQEGSGVVNLGLILNRQSDAALARGTAVHALLSRIRWSTDLPAKADWVRSISHEEADLEICASAADELYPRLSTPEDPLGQTFSQSAWLQKWKASQVTRLDLWQERRFAVIIGDSLMNGSFDRVVLGYDSKGQLVEAEILDFKTDRINNETDRQSRALHYQPQLDAYQSALHRLTGLKVTSIGMRLVWISN
jgi:ATP-dependent helicase/nuclease subunit A